MSAVTGWQRRSGCSRPGLVLATALLLAALAAGPISAMSGRVAATTSETPLEDVYADVALLPPAAGLPGRLMALREIEVAERLELRPRMRGEERPAGRLEAVLLERSRAGWAAVAAAALPPPFDAAAGLPWLVPVDPADGRWVVMRSSAPARRTAVTTLTVSGGSLSIGVTTEIRFLADAAGAADVDGDGLPELVLGATTTRRGEGACQDTRLLALDPYTRAMRARIVLQGIRLGGATLAEVDGTPGADLVGHAYRNCPAGPLVETGGRLRAIRLADGSTIAELAAEATPAVGSAAGIPFAFDVDGDAIDELIARLGGDTVLIDPVRGWETVDVGRAQPLMLAARTPDGPGVVGMIEDPAAEGRAPSVLIARIDRSSPGARLGLRDVARLSPPVGTSIDERPRWWLASRVGLGETIRGTLPTGWVGDLDGDHCMDLVIPLAVARCPMRSTAGVTLGPAWLATRPIAALDTVDGRRLLVAAGVDWDPQAAGLAAPAPTESWAHSGGWRAGPSARFTLHEVDTALPAPKSGRGLLVLPTSPAAEPRATVLGRVGDRVLARIDPGRGAIGERTETVEPGGSPSVDEPGTAAAPGAAGWPDWVRGFLIGTRAGEQATLVTVGPRLAGRQAEPSTRIPLDPAAGEDRPAAPTAPSATAGEPGPDALGPGWRVRVLAIDPLGEVAGPAARVVVVDARGPELTIEPPFVSAPWPLSATLEGSSEPGAAITLAGDPGRQPVLADPRGRFAVQVTLAPWPQEVLVRAEDGAGNERVVRVSIVGGLDYRQVPWHLLVIGLVFVGLAVSARRATPRRSGPLPGPGERPSTVRTAPDAWDGPDPLPAIEDLPAGSRRR